MNIEVKAKERSQTTALDIVDCDFHPKLTLEQLQPFLSNQWWNYLQTIGNRSRHGYSKGYAYPKMTPQAARRDASRLVIFEMSAWVTSGSPGRLGT